MKAKTLRSAVLVALLGASLAAPMATFAEDEVETPETPKTPKSLSGKGQIIFEQNDGAEDIILPGDPEDKVDPQEPVKVNPDRNSFSIDALTELDFGKHDVEAFLKAQTYTAAAAMLQSEKSGADKVKSGNFVQFTDKRAVSGHNYTVSAQLTQQFKSIGAGSSSVLKGADINYANLSLSSKVDEGNYPTIANEMFTLAPATNGKDAGDSVPVVTNNNETNPMQGIGTFSLSFGSPAVEEGDTDTTDSSITLTVPNDNALIQDTYVAEITWTIAETA